MIALDTNVLVRYLTQDDPIHSARATALIEGGLSDSDPGFISIPVLCEMLWTLRSRYGRGQAELVAIVSNLLDARHFVVDQAGIVWEAIRQAPAELTDAIIHEIGRTRGCHRTVTFDRDFAHLDGVDLLA